MSCWNFTDPTVSLINEKMFYLSFSKISALSHEEFSLFFLQPMWGGHLLQENECKACCAKMNAKLFA